MKKHQIKSLCNISRTIAVMIVGVICSHSMAQIIDDEAVKRAKDLVSQMTLREKIDYLSGETSFSLRAIPRLGIPRILLADGPCGIRNHAPHSTLFPSGILTAATWNRNVAHLLGEGLGDDARARGVGILLGPGVNIYRSPLCGRNYEYFGEDPYLTSEIACQYIEGVQSRGVMATIKHFCGNNQEWSRHHTSSDIDERTLQEIYFPAFRKAVQQAHVGAVMDSYNLLNGVHATENAWLNKTILRDTWGFKGLLMSDWTSVYSVVNTANNGLDLEMPKGRNLNYENLYPAIKKGLVTEATIDQKVQHILQSLIAFGLLDRQQKDTTIALNYAPSRQKALQIAREGIVLLKNNKNTLPLKGRTALVGENANIVATGGGSGFVNPFASTTLSAALKKAKPNLIVLTDDVIYDDVNAEVYMDAAMTKKGFLASYYKNQKLSGTPDSTHVDDKIAFDWGYDSIGPGFPKDHFSARWSFYYKSKEDGLLRISMGGDDGYRIFVNDKLLTGDWGNHAYSHREKTFKVEKGKMYHFVLEYFDNISSAAVSCNISRLNEKKLECNNVIVEWLERTAESPNEKVRISSIFMLAAKYIQMEKYKEANIFLDKIPDTVIDGTIMKTSVLAHQEGTDIAAFFLEGKLMQTVTNIQNYLYKLIEMEEETGNHCKAEEIAEITEHMVLLFDLWDYGKVVPYLLIAVYRKDVEKCIQLIKEVLMESQKPWKMVESPLYYRYAGTVQGKSFSGVGNNFVRALATEIENKEEYEFLKGNKELEAIFSQYLK